MKKQLLIPLIFATGVNLQAAPQEITKREQDPLIGTIRVLYLPPHGRNGVGVRCEKYVGNGRWTHATPKEYKEYESRHSADRAYPVGVPIDVHGLEPYSRPVNGLVTEERSPLPPGKGIRPMPGRFVEYPNILSEQGLGYFKEHLIDSKNSQEELLNFFIKKQYELSREIKDLQSNHKPSPRETERLTGLERESESCVNLIKRLEKKLTHSEYEQFINENGELIFKLLASPFMHQRGSLSRTGRVIISRYPDHKIERPEHPAEETIYRVVFFKNFAIEYRFKNGKWECIGVKKRKVQSYKPSWYYAKGMSPYSTEKAEPETGLKDTDRRESVYK